jgi:Uma2 family endonuclease
LDRDQATPDDEYLTGAPDLVVEVLSPGNTVDEINDRIATCMANGCVSFWVVDPKRRLVSVTEGKVTTHYWASDAVSCQVFPGEIPVREIFE